MQSAASVGSVATVSPASARVSPVLDLEPLVGAIVVVGVRDYGSR